MRKKGTIEFELLINEPEGSGAIYQSNIDNDIAAMLITANVLQSKIDAAKQAKKETERKGMKDLIGKEIHLMSKGLAAINILANSLCAQYDQYVSYMENQRALEVQNEITLAKETGEIPKEIVD